MIQFIVKVEDNGQVMMDSNIINDPMRLVGLLDISKQMILDNFLHPKITPAIQPASAQDLDKFDLRRTH